MGAVNYKEIWVWIKNHIQNNKIKKLLGVEFIRTPSRSAVAEILAEVNYLELEKVFRIWIYGLVDKTDNLQQLAVDGKVMNGSSVNANKSTEVLSAVLANTGIILAHKKISNKSEVPALRELIDELDDSFIYTFDAMNTKKNSKQD